jgi:hypothetical protein
MTEVITNGVQEFLSTSYSTSFLFIYISAGVGFSSHRQIFLQFLVLFKFAAICMFCKMNPRPRPFGPGDQSGSLESAGHEQHRSSSFLLVLLFSVYWSTMIAFFVPEIRK